jgi:hypothetical protein
MIADFRAGKSFEWCLKGYIRNDPRISHFVRLKTLAASGLSWLLLLAVVKKSLARKDSRQKPSRMMARNILLIFSQFTAV